MAGYSIRTLADLSRAARGYFTGAVTGAVASVWANTFTVFAKVLAQLDHLHDLRRAWLFRQMFASTAEEIWLIRHGFELGLAPAPGLRALGAIGLSAPPGTRVPAGLSFVREDGVSYTSLAPALAGAGGIATLYLEADVVGSAGNCPPGATLALSPDTPAPDGVGASGTVLAEVDGSGLSGGVDREAIEVFRARVLARKRSPPHGGAGPDYEEWLRQAVPSAAGVWVDAFANDARSVWVAFTVTDAETGGLRLPTAGELAAAQAYLDDPVRRPVTARVFAVALNAVPVDLLIGGLSPDTPDIRAAVAAELAAVFLDRAAPGQPTKGPFSLSRSWLEEAVSRATGEDRHRLPVPAGDLTFTAGQYPVLGTIAYTD